MNEIKYLGEHLWVGQVGHIFVILGFVAALLSAFAYYVGTQNDEQLSAQNWLKIGRTSFYIHSFSIIGLILVIFYAMYHHMYEYSYVFDHVSQDLPLKYILSAFWEGQEGSFMLWMFWHSILGIILIKTTGKLQGPVLFVIALAEAILMTMILGIQIPWGESSIKIGSNPTVLLRQMMDAPIFNNADYLSLIKGRGLNPLLQNYWMTIHPPTLFLGFASTIVPFAFAFAGLWKKDNSTWMKPCFSWALFSAAILGTGILMGSLWAYVALSFGGYWAWDPVENASLVPWITLVAGIHVHLINRNTGYASKSVYFYYLISFVLILYSTFLTRSGILGDTSAHAFTEMGLEWQLIILVKIFALLGMGMLIYRYKSIKNPIEEEPIASREFWMFIGSIVLFFSGALITYSTSLPVLNKIIDIYQPGYAGKVIKNPIEHYNKYQLWIGFFVALLSSITLFLRYKAANWGMNKAAFYKNIGIIFGLSLVLCLVFTMWLPLHSWQYYLLCFAGSFGVIASLQYIFFITKMNIKLAYSAVAHLGFGLMLLGLLSSGLNQKSISTNPFVFSGMFTAEDLAKYVQLIKGKPLMSEGYLITYESDTLIGKERKYQINFKKLNDSLDVIDEMTLFPNAVYSNDFQKVAAFNPDTKHYFSKDIFTCIVGLPPAKESVEKSKAIEDSLKFESHLIPLHDTMQLGNLIFRIDSVVYEPKHLEYQQHPHDLGMGIAIAVTDKTNDSTFVIEPAVGIEGAMAYNYPIALEDYGIRVKLSENILENYFTQENKLDYHEVSLKDKSSVKIGEYDVSLEGFDKAPTNKNYTKKEGDLAIGAMLKISKNGQFEMAKPLYVIRDNQPMSIKHYAPNSGMHIRFSNIDPEKETFTFKIAQDVRIKAPLEIGIAQDVPRSDYIILQATVFPGINLFWAGSMLMMVGLFLAAWSRIDKNWQR